MIQKLLHMCHENIDKDKDDDLFQTFAVLGIALVALREDIGSEMASRLLNHIMHYGEPATRKAVPLALGLLYISNPQNLTVLDTLSKYSHDTDIEVNQAAIFAMGLVGAGTNNARLAQMFRQLASYYNREPSNLYTTRLAQGLLHMGKGMLTLNPWHSHRMILSKNAIAGLLGSIIAFTDSKFCKSFF
jgi:26S proteasome regulatory subunit N1